MVKQIYSEPCIRCGLCCKMEICNQGIMLLNKFSAPCPALEKRNGKHCCGLINNTSKYVFPGALSEKTYNEIRQYLLGVFEFGVGCDSKLRSPENMLARIQHRQLDSAPAAARTHT